MMTYLKRHRRFLALATMVLCILAVASSAAAQSHILRVMAYWDPLDGDPAPHPARINVSRSYMTDTCYVHAGSPDGPSRLYNRPDTTGVMPYAYIGQSGEFLVSIPDTVNGNIRARIWMGPEALAETLIVNWLDVNTTVRCTIEQVVDMADSGWHCMDPWVHLNDTDYNAYDIDREDVRAVMEAEGLDAINCLDTSWDDATFAYGRNNDTELWNNHGLAVWFQSQAQDGVWGYVLPIRTTAAPTVDGALTAHMGQRSPGFMAERWYDRVDSLSGYSILAGGRRVRGLSDTTTTNGARRSARDMWFSPFDATLTDPDAVLICEPLMGPPHGSASLTNPNVRTYKDYRNVLACGGDLVTPVGGSNAALNSWRGKAAMGSWRTYMMIGEGMSASWYPFTMSRGHSYISNGPLITYAKLDGHSLGTTLAIDPGDTLTLTVGIHSPIVVDTIRIWLNGTIYSSVNLTPSRTDTTFTADIPIYGGTDSYLWFDLVAKNDDLYLNWTEAQSSGRLYAIATPWFIDVAERSLRPTRGSAVIVDAKLDTINTLYLTTYDSWPDKHTTRSSADSLEWVTRYADVETESKDRMIWVRPSARSLKDGTAEFPYTDVRTAMMTNTAANDTCYFYSGDYSRAVLVTNLTTSDVVYRGFPEISRPSQVAINMSTKTTSFVTETDANDVAFKWMCFRNATALANNNSTFTATAVADWTWDHIWFKNYDCGDADSRGCITAIDCTGDIIIRDCLFDSLDGGQYFVTVMSRNEQVYWLRNRVTRSSFHENQPTLFESQDNVYIYDSLFADLDGGDDRAPALQINTPAGRHRIVGCTFNDVETHQAGDQAYGIVLLNGASCDSLVTVSNCVFANTDSTKTIGFVAGATQIDSLLYSLSFNCASWPPAAGDTLGLLGTDPHFNLTRLDRMGTLRPTDVRTMELGLTYDWMGWTEACPPVPAVSLVNDQFGSSSGGSGGGRPSKPTRISELPPPGS